MKINHKLKLGGRNLTLGLSFQTSLTLLDELESPTVILQEVVRQTQAQSEGKAHTPSFVLNERTAVQILEIGNRDTDGLSFDEIGQLCFKTGFMEAYAAVLDYVMAMTMSHTELTEDDIEGETKAGDSSGN